MLRKRTGMFKSYQEARAPNIITEIGVSRGNKFSSPFVRLKTDDQVVDNVSGRLIESRC